VRETERKQHIGKMRNECQILLGKTKHLDQGLDGRIVLKFILKEIRYINVDRIQ